MGRPAGSPNRATTQRKLISEHRADGVPLAKEVLERYMLYYVDAANRIMPKLPLKLDPDEAERAKLRLFNSLVEKAAFFARALAPYQSPTYRSITVQAPRDSAARGTPAIDALEAFVLTLAAVRKKEPEPQIIESEPDDMPTLVAIKRNGP